MKIPFFSTMRSSSSSSSRRKSQQQEQQQQQHESQEVLATGGGGDGDESATKCTRKGHKVHPDTDDNLAGPVTEGVLAMSGHARDVDVDNVKENVKGKPEEHKSSQQTTKVAPGLMLAPDVVYYHLYADDVGNTHLREFTMGGFGSGRTLNDLPDATATIFASVPREWDNPWHRAPCPQWVVTLSGSWWVRTTDGMERTFGPGEILFQDNTEALHYSGSRTGCTQIIVQASNFPSTVNLPGPF